MEQTPLDLSLCFIARNEQHNLPRALASVRPVAREIIVVDTGSTDDTPRVAADLGARVLTHPFRDHFAEARNVALEAAAGTWVLMLDADEELMADSLGPLARALRSPALAQVVEVHHVVDGARLGAPLRSLLLFRRHPRIRYRGRVHESVVDSVLALGGSHWPTSGVQVLHHGYQDAAERQRKAARNLRLLEMAVTEEPDDLYLRLKLAQTLPRGERRRAVLAQAMERARRLSAAAQTLPYLPRLYALAGDALLEVGAQRSTIQLCTDLLEALGVRGAFTAGRLSLLAGDLDRAEVALQRYLRAVANGTDLGALELPDPEASPAAALHLLGFLAMTQGRSAEADVLLARALDAKGQGAGQWGHRAAVEADRLRLQLRAGKLGPASAGMEAMAAALGAAPERRRHSEVMLLAAELSLHSGDLLGALPLSQAAVDPGRPEDDRAAALGALLALRARPGDRAALRPFRPSLPGARFDTLAVRLVVDERLADEPGPLPRAEDAELLAATQVVHRSLVSTLPR